MVDITHKSFSKRTAKAQAIVFASEKITIERIKNNDIPKGNVLDFARAAALLAIKNTFQVIPDCHPLPIEHTQIQFELNEKEIKIIVMVETIYKTGVEVEAMHGAMIAALTLYDMLKPIDKYLEIGAITLLEKKGGKSDKQKDLAIAKNIRARVVVCSDSVFAKTKEDKAGAGIVEKLQTYEMGSVDKIVVPDEKLEIEKTCIEAEKEGIQLLIYTGGTGLSPRDITPEAIAPLLHQNIPGIMEAARNYGMERTSLAMLSRGLAGMRNKMLVLCLPGSTKGALESMQALFPACFHIFLVQEHFRHDES